jgi:glycosyltransferase involved in cell wall biosynthesis
MYAAALFVSWVAHHGRSAALAERLDAETAFVAVGRSGQRWLVPVRYARQAARTVRLVRRRRPDVLVVMGPPLALLVVARLVHRGPLVLDAHTGAVLRRGRVRWLFRVVARRADVVVVASESLARLVETETGIPALAVHDPLTGSGDATTQKSASSRHQNGGGAVVFPASWRADEPIDAVLGAARLVPDVGFVITGRAPGAVRVPDNVRLTGFLADDDYDAVLADAGVVLALTTRALTMQRAGYEALERACPLVASDTEVLRELFTGGTVFAAPTAASLAGAITEALDRREVLAKEMAELRDERVAADERAVAALREAIAAC